MTINSVRNPQLRKSQQTSVSNNKAKLCSYKPTSSPSRSGTNGIRCSTHKPSTHTQKGLKSSSNNDKLKDFCLLRNQEQSVSKNNRLKSYKVDSKTPRVFYDTPCLYREYDWKKKEVVRECQPYEEVCHPLGQKYTTKKPPKTVPIADPFTDIVELDNCSLDPHRCHDSSTVGSTHQTLNGANLSWTYKMSAVERYQPITLMQDDIDVDDAAYKLRLPRILGTEGEKVVKFHSITNITANSEVSLTRSGRETPPMTTVPIINTSPQTKKKKKKHLLVKRKLKDSESCQPSQIFTKIKPPSKELKIRKLVDVGSQGDSKIKPYARADNKSLGSWLKLKHEWYRSDGSDLGSGDDAKFIGNESLENTIKKLNSFFDKTPVDNSFGQTHVENVLSQAPVVEPIASNSSAASMRMGKILKLAHSSAKLSEISDFYFLSFPMDKNMFRSPTTGSLIGYKKIKFLLHKVTRVFNLLHEYIYVMPIRRGRTRYLMVKSNKLVEWKSTDLYTRYFDVDATSFWEDSELNHLNSPKSEICVSNRSGSAILINCAEHGHTVASFAEEFPDTETARRAVPTSSRLARSIYNNVKTVSTLTGVESEFLLQFLHFKARGTIRPIGEVKPKIPVSIETEVKKLCNIGTFLRCLNETSPSTFESLIKEVESRRLKSIGKPADLRECSAKENELIRNYVKATSDSDNDVNKKINKSYLASKIREFLRDLVTTPSKESISKNTESQRFKIVSLTKSPWIIYLVVPLSVFLIFRIVDVYKNFF